MEDDRMPDSGGFEEEQEEVEEVQEEVRRPSKDMSRREGGL